MAWPAELASLGVVTARRTPPPRRPRRGPTSRVLDATRFRRRYVVEARGLWRIFGPAVYRFYRNQARPPRQGDTPFATSATLPHEPADAFADGTWYLAVSWFNGVLDSGFLPLGPSGETYLRLDVASGAAETSPPAGPVDVRLEARAGGVVRVIAYALRAAAAGAEEWAIAYTTNGSDPPADTPDVTQAMREGVLDVLAYDLPAQGDGVTVKVRVQTRRNDGSVDVPDWTYSEGSKILTMAADAAGPTAGEGLAAWEGGG